MARPKSFPSKQRYAVGAQVLVKMPGVVGTVVQVDDVPTVFGEYWHTIRTEHGDRREPGSNLELVPKAKTNLEDGVARSAKPQPKGPDWPTEQTLRVLKQQFEKLQALKGRNCAEADQDETIWQQTTQAALIHGFGEDSHNVSNFNWARHAGIQSMMGISPQQAQLNFEARIQQFEATVLSSIAELEASMPEAEIKGAYDAGDEYAFYRDLKDIMAQAKIEIFIVDNYLNTEFFDLYVAVVKPGVTLRIMTDQMKGNLGAVAKKYAGSHSIELRSSPDVHDRHIFVDDRGWSVGQSIKDAAKRKPTYMVELSFGLIPVIRKIYEDIWAKAAVVVKS